MRQVLLAVHEKKRERRDRPRYWCSNGDRSPSSTSRRIFAAITGVRDHLRRSSRRPPVPGVRRLRGQPRSGHDHPSRRTARSASSLGAPRANDGIRPQADRIACAERSIPRRECRPGITCGIAGLCPALLSVPRDGRRLATRRTRGPARHAPAGAADCQVDSPPGPTGRTDPSPALGARRLA
jgi:hypothetical protein